MDYIRLSVHEGVTMLCRMNTRSLHQMAVLLRVIGSRTHVYTQTIPIFGVYGDEMRSCVYVDKNLCCLCVRLPICPSALWKATSALDISKSTKKEIIYSSVSFSQDQYQFTLIPGWTNNHDSTSLPAGQICLYNDHYPIMNCYVQNTYCRALLKEPANDFQTASKINLS